MTLQKAIERYLAPCYSNERKFVIIFRGQDSSYAPDLATALRQAVLLSFVQIRKTGRFFPVYVKENKTSRILCRLEERDKVLKLAEKYFGLKPKGQDQESLAR